MTSNTNSPIVITSLARTPIGGFQGELSALPAPKIGAAAISAALARANLKPDQVSEVLMGCVLPAGQGQAPARQAAFGAGLPDSVPCTTVNKMCGSGMKTLMMAYEALHTRPDDIIVAGGMESMTNAPYLLPKARGGLRLGHGQVLDHMFIDGLEDAYDTGRLMGTYAEDTAQHYQFTRADQDDYAISSLERAKRANEDGRFADEIAPITVADRKGETVIERDEQPFTAKPQKIPQLRPAFRPDGTVTAANSSSISDGAAALVLMTLAQADKLGVKPLAKICGVSSHAQAPAWFTTAPIEAIRKLQETTGWRTEDADLYEINEAFAVVAMAAIRDLGLPRDIVNINGGACALGHPIGASGARIVATLINALKQEGGKRGIAAICIGGGEATAMAVELM
ncbi:MAG TPA: acetyl-CoA C-acyltransferase [Hyphomicrobiales bacterium]|nr:acetyl-CoA C-acyltransferase [Hyphomicrobiales bacterium]